MRLQNMSQAREQDKILEKEARKMELSIPTRVPYNGHKNASQNQEKKGGAQWKLQQSDRKY